jgi:hypothetical protein
MSGFQRTVAGACLGALLQLAFSAPCVAGPSAVPTQVPAVRQLHLTAVPLDLRLLAKGDPGGGPAGAVPNSAPPGSIALQTSGGGWSGLSTAKKTWIIVGIVVGAAVIVAVVSNSGDDNGGGGY